MFDSSHCLNDEIDTFAGFFKLRLDFTTQRFTGINNTNIIIFRLNMCKDSLMKCRSHFLITTFLFVTRKKMNFIYAFYHLLICFAIHSITIISGSLSNVCGYVLALAVRFLDIGYLVIDDGIY